jgi:hypothetical protein
VKIDKLRADTENALKEAGYQAGSWTWVEGPNRLVLSVRGQLCTVKLPGGMGRHKWERAIGYLQGLAEGARILDRVTA